MSVGVNSSLYVCKTGPNRVRLGIGNASLTGDLAKFSLHGVGKQDLVLMIRDIFFKTTR